MLSTSAKQTADILRTQPLQPLPSSPFYIEEDEGDGEREEEDESET